MRIERDSIGRKMVPQDAYYGVQSMRAQENFSIMRSAIHPALIRSLAVIKKAAAISNYDTLKKEKISAISRACDEIIAGRWHEFFIVDAIQGGAGTSANMNANEVIANRAIEILGGQKGDYTVVHPNDDVNKCQSTNDVFPSAGKLALLETLPALKLQLERLEAALDQKAQEFAGVIKMARTQLQDAVPTTVGRSFAAYRSLISRNLRSLDASARELHVLNLGGTAIGNGVNASRYYREQIMENLRLETGRPLEQAEDLMDATQNLDGLVRFSAELKATAVNLSKLCHDLRLLSSGPRAGLGEIDLPARQNGSSIMPGKVNPVIPEVVNQVAFRVIGNDLTVTMAAEAGQLELNAFEPVVFHSLLESLELMTRAVATLTDNCITGITVNADHCRQQAESNAGIATALCPVLGYQKAADIAKESLRTGRTVRELVLSRHLLSADETDRLLKLEVMAGVPLSEAVAVASVRD